MLDANYWAVWHLPELHRRYGRHPGVLGYHISDDNGDLYQVNVDTAWWLRTFAPDRVPWMTQNPNPIPQSRCAMPVVTSQNYPWLYHGNAPEKQLQRGFMDTCNTDRLSANRYDMASWMIVFSHVSPSQYRFQMNAAAAYGAQGVWQFVYSSYLRDAMPQVSRPANHYLVRIAGPHLLGRRCWDVVHTGEAVPPLQGGPRPGGLIEAMDDELSAGILVPDSDFQAGRIAPDCVYVVDKRTVKFAERQELAKLCPRQRPSGWTMPPRGRELIRKMLAEDPKPRAASLTFGPMVASAEALLPDGSVRRYDLGAGRRIELPALPGGGAVLLRIRCAKPLRRIVVPEGTLAEALPLHWKFSRDNKNAAQKEGWHALGFDDKAWKKIRVPAFGGWSRQSQGAAGTGWYRMRVAVPEALRKKHLYLHFGAADEQAWVYVDGKLAVEHSCGSMKAGVGTLWTQPFHCEVADRSRDGAGHTIAVRVANNWGTGGLYEPVYWIASDEPLDADQLWRVHKRENANWEWLWQ